MTNEEAAAMLERMKNYFLPTSPMLEERREITALDLAISALSKQSASCEQADHIADSDKMVDQFRDDTKKTDFKPGDKFILELGTERKMFGEFEFKGTDLYVKTDLLEKLTRYEPGENPGNLGENPGIIRCNACKYWIQTVGRMQGYGLGKCDFHDANLVNCNGFCYWAERRNDG